ncbi:MAG: hypothetical protein JKY61_06415 [Planctomycetes bacterium]|nr:hypothetical protein [Planctomycetota bacterium]
MFSPFSSYTKDSAGDAIAAEAGLIYRPLHELKGLLARSRNVHFFSWGLGAFAVSLAVLHGMGLAGDLRDSSSLAGIGGFAAAVFYGVAALGAGLRTGWGRFACMVISAALLSQAAWFVSSPSHWSWNLDSAVMLGRFLVGWIGLVSFVGTHELFGSHRIGHAILKDAVEGAQEARIQESNLLDMHAEGLRVASRAKKPTQAA